MKRQKIKAFTLLEIVLAMMLSAIVVGMAYTAFTLFSKLYGNYRAKNLSHSDLLLTRDVLDHDFNQAFFAEKVENELWLRDSLGNLRITYKPIQDYLLRDNRIAIDSLRLKGVQIEFSFEGMIRGNGLIDQLVLRFSYNKKLQTLCVSKIYSSEQLFNWKDIAWRR